jgi:outer membrane protein
VKPLFILLLSFCLAGPAAAATAAADSAWSLQDCISYALENNIGVRKSMVSTRISEANEELSKAARYPSVSGGITQNFSWNSQEVTLTSANLVGLTGTNFSVSTGVTVFSGFKLSNQVRQSAIATETEKYNAGTARETVTLNVLNAYLQILYAEEQVNSSSRQAELTGEQLVLAGERMDLGSIARSDYLQVKSQLASEKQTLAAAESSLAMNRIILLQHLELPAGTGITFDHTLPDPVVGEGQGASADSVYRVAEAIMPQVRSAGLNRESSEIGEKIAMAALYPSLSVSAGLGYSISGDVSSLNAWDNRLSPTVGLSLSIPVYQNGQARSGMKIARLNTATAELEETNTRNELRKTIEQAAQDIRSAEKEYLASQEGYLAAAESYAVADERFRQGLISPVDFLVQKTGLATAESKRLQSKYKLVFYRKILDYYSGVPLTL